MSTGWAWLEEAWHPESGLGLLGLLVMMGTHQEPQPQPSGARECPALGFPEGHGLHLSKRLRGLKDTLVGMTLEDEGNLNEQPWTSQEGAWLWLGL